MINMFWFKPQPPPKIVNISVEVDVYIYLDSRCLDGYLDSISSIRKMPQISFPTYITVATELFGLKETILICWCFAPKLIMVNLKTKMTNIKLYGDDDVVPL